MKHIDSLRKLISTIAAVVMINSGPLLAQTKVEKVMTRFYNNVEKNYPHVPLVHSVALSEVESLQNGILLYSNTAEIEYLRNSYLTMETDRMKLMHGLNRIHIDSLFEDHLYGGFAEIEKDLIKYPQDFMHLDYSKYEYVLSTVELDSQKVFKVSFKPTTRKSKFEGTIYLDAASYALIKAEYSLSEYGIDKLNKISPDFKWKEISETITYERPNEVKHYLDDHDRYYLSSITTEGSGFHMVFGQELTVTTALRVVDTNRTTFFANEYYRIDDNIALSELDYSKHSVLGRNQEKFMDVTTFIAQETEMSSNKAVDMSFQED